MTTPTMKTPPVVSREDWTAAHQAMLAKEKEFTHARANAAHAGHLKVRKLLLLGRLDEAERTLEELDPTGFGPATRALHHLAAAGIALRRLNTAPARAALERAMAAAREARIPALAAEISMAAQALAAPAARLVAGGEERLMRLADVEALQASDLLVVDACRHRVRDAGGEVSLATRPVLFAIARALAEAWPGDLARDVLLARAFGARSADESHRARLRVEVGRLRAELRGLAEINATPRGFALAPRSPAGVAVLARPIEERHADVLALLSDGESWSSSALALALGVSQRNVQRALDALAAAGKVEAFGRGRARRWLTPPVVGFTTTLLLPQPLPGG